MENVRDWIEDNPRSYICGGYGGGWGSGYGVYEGNGNGAGENSQDELYGDSYGHGKASGSGEASGTGFGRGEGVAVQSASLNLALARGRFYFKNCISFDGKPVYVIDGLPTIITGVTGALAKGFIIGPDFTLGPCYIVKKEGCFAHGETINEAIEALREKNHVEYTVDEFLSL